MKRREFIAGLAGAAAAAVVAARAQELGRTYRIGLLVGALDSPVMTPAYPALRDELRKRGFIEGRNLIVEVRSIRQEPQRLFADVADLVHSNVDLIVAIGPEIALKAVLAASRTIPIVMWAGNFDPLEHGYVQSLARPGGNVTGIFTRQPELAAKQVELLKETFPERTRVTVLADALSTDQLRSAEDVAKSLHLNLRPLKLENPPYDIEAAFRRVVESDPQMLLVLSSPLFGPQHKEIAEQTIHHRLPAIFMFKNFVVEGGLISYGPHVPASFRRVADYVAKILNGTKPDELPVEQPTRFELVVNLKTAKAIGIELPTSLLLRADEVIE